MTPRTRQNLLDGGVNPRARRNPLEGGVNPRARRNLLEGAFDWATLVGRGGHRSVGRALCVRCLFLFFAGFKWDSPGLFRGPSGLSPTLVKGKRTKPLHKMTSTKETFYSNVQ
jgi:hypothetical protein